MPLSTSDPIDFDQQQAPRFLRVCLVHRETLDDRLYCDTGKHHVLRWGTLDVRRDLIYGGGSYRNAYLGEHECKDALVDLLDLGKRSPLNRRRGVTPRAYRELRRRVHGGMQEVTVHLPPLPMQQRVAMERRIS